jgi:hypothetical protein
LRSALFRLGLGLAQMTGASVGTVLLFFHRDESALVVALMTTALTMGSVVLYGRRR